MCDKAVDALIDELEQAEELFAQRYLEYRAMESVPGRLLSVDDARANAVLWMRKNGKPLPEVCRYRLHHALAIERSVEPS